MTTYYKFLNENNIAKYSGFDYTPYLPNGNTRGKWLPKIENLDVCNSGYHVSKRNDILHWSNDKAFIAVGRGKSINNKTVYQQICLFKEVKGWNKKNLRLAAADIIEKISLPIWKKYYLEDSTLENVIDVVRRYARGDATDHELSAAESAAVRAAVRAAESAAWSAAESAAWSAAAGATRSAAESATRSAVWNAAWSAAAGATRSAALNIICKRCGIKQS